jgi:pyruvate dehydrogenase E1 component beta subunit
VATGYAVRTALGAAESLAHRGVSVEVIDPRTIAPLDVDTILSSVARTRHLVLVDQATRHSSVAAVIAAEVAELGFSSLEAPISMVTALDSSIAYSKPVEEFVLPDEHKVIRAVEASLGLAPAST